MRKGDGRLVGVLMAWMLLVRLLLTAILLLLVFRETGPWTVVTLALVVFGVEAQLRLLKGDAR